MIVNAAHALTRATIQVSMGRRGEVFMTIDSGRPLALDTASAIQLADALQRAAEYAERRRI